ncbi:MAG: hypothetical protein IJS46_00105, partial [Kiritimatiellae bacterium]|nr:hypothetical protein [Kiritimatiellia bacterium]
ACMDWSVGSKDVAADPTRWGVGAASLGGGAHPLWGTVKSVRLYDRMLSEDELAWNRSVDSARYFGALATTNVVVVAGDYSGLAEDTAYEVFGSATFSAVTAQDGSTANFVHIRTLAADGSVTDVENVEGVSYTYTAGTSPDRVEIEFRKTNPFVMVVR